MNQVTEKESYLFLTGHMAEENLRAQLKQIGSDTFQWDVMNVGVKVAALMTDSLLVKRLPKLLSGIKPPDKIFLPGLFGGNVEQLSATFDIPFSTGPTDLRDLPEFFGAAAKDINLNNYSCLIFAEIVEAPFLTPEQMLRRALYYRDCGADVIDIGCLPGKDFPHLGDSIRMLKAEGLAVSVDSASDDELLCGAKAGADYLLSLTEKTLWIAEETDAVPVIIPLTPSDQSSLYRAMDTLSKKAIPFFADPILDPILMGFTDSVLRYKTLREMYPECQIFMGIGNVTELMDADTAGSNSLLMGIVEELNIQAVLSTEVGDHAVRAIVESDLSRRIMHAAGSDNALPKRYHNGLLGLHERKPFPYQPEEIAELAAGIREKNYRIQVSDEGVHLFNKDTYSVDADPFELMRTIDVSDDWTHSFYLGVELARAQIAWQLGKRYVQDHELKWGVADRRAKSEWMGKCREQTASSDVVDREAKPKGDEITPEQKDQ